MKLYLDSGYLDMEAIISQGFPFTFIIGPRGTGKTYGAIDYVLRHGTPFILMRRTQMQAELISNPVFSPLTTPAQDKGILWATKSLTKQSAGIYRGMETDTGIEPTGAPIGITAALSTFSNMRGFDASFIDMIIYDEFIPEAHERPLRAEYEALMNVYETVNRNRELKGRKPVQLVALSNSNTINSPILVSAKLIMPIQKAIKAGRAIVQDRKRGIMVIIATGSPISEAKRGTALYQAQDGQNGFTAMALDNVFPTFSNSTIRSLNRGQLSPIAAVGEIDISNVRGSDKLYCSGHFLSCPVSVGTSDVELDRFDKRYGPTIRRAYFSNSIIFENEICELLLTKYLRL